MQGSSGAPVGIEDPHPLGSMRWDCEVEGTEATMQYDTNCMPPCPWLCLPQAAIGLQ